MPERCTERIDPLQCVKTKGHYPGCVMSECFADDLPFNNAYPGPVLDDETETWGAFLRDVPHDDKYEVAVVGEAGPLVWLKPPAITAFNRFTFYLVRGKPEEVTSLVTAFMAFRDGRKIRNAKGEWQEVYGMVKRVSDGYHIQGRLGEIIKYVQHLNEFVEVLDD